MSYSMRSHDRERDFLATTPEYCGDCARILNRRGECPDPGCGGSPSDG